MHADPLEDVNPTARALWARTRLHVWPEPLQLVSLPLSALDQAAALLARTGPFAALVLERDEVSLTVATQAWLASPLVAQARAQTGALRAITFDIDLELGLCGYLAPAARRLAQAGVSIVPQCAFHKDHLLVAEGDLARAVATLRAFVHACGEAG